jgi:2,5-diketo-D-gluconate reductase A
MIVITTMLSIHSWRTSETIERPSMMQSTTMEIAPGVWMPLLSLGHIPDDMSPRPSVRVEHFAQWLRAGGVGLDTAVQYHNHQFVRRALQGSGRRRSDFFLTTKIWRFCESSTAAAQVLAEANRSVQELGVEYVDLLLLHTPCISATGDLDANVGPWRGLQEAMRAGLTRAIGVSNFGPGLLTQLLELAGPRPVINQLQLSIGSHQSQWHDQLRDVAASGKVTLQAYSPLLSGGSLHTLAEHPVVARVARSHRMSTVQVCLRWLIQRGHPAAVSPGSELHMREDLAALDPSFQLSDDEMASLSTIVLPLCSSYRNCLPEGVCPIIAGQYLPAACCCRSAGAHSDPDRR